MDLNQPITHEDAVELESIALKLAYVAVRAEIAAEENDALSGQEKPLTFQDLKDDIVDFRRLHPNVQESAQEIPVDEENEEREAEQAFKLIVPKARPEGMEPFTENEAKEFQTYMMKTYGVNTRMKAFLRQLRHVGHWNDSQNVEGK